MDTFPRQAEDYLPLLTSAVLENYAQYLLKRNENVHPVHTQHTTGIVAPILPSYAAGTRSTPASVEEALAPLEVLYGKTALSAIGIALHGMESVIRYVERADSGFSGEDDDDREGSGDGGEELMRHQGGVDATESAASQPTPLQPFTPQVGPAPSSPTTASHSRQRCLYHVGEHTLFSPYYCPCSAYAYQSIQRQEVWCCKHLLALQLALRIEGTGIPQDNLQVRIIDTTEYEQLLVNALM